MFPLNSGGYFLPVKAKSAAEPDIGAGDEVTVTLDAALPAIALSIVGALLRILRGALEAVGHSVEHRKLSRL